MNLTQASIIDPAARILVTGANGFIGNYLAEALLRNGFRNVRCLTRHSADPRKLQELARKFSVELEVFRGNLLSPEDCNQAVRGVSVIYHLAAGTGEKSFADAFMNSVVTTRNLIAAAINQNVLKRFVSISSFAVYSNRSNPVKGLLDEQCPVEDQLVRRGEAYCYAKLKQDELVMEYGRTTNFPYVILRPGVVYGPGKAAISGRIGRDLLGLFLHMGGRNKIPFIFVENCADAIMLAGLVPEAHQQIINLVDDNLPTSRQFLKAYKRKVAPLRSIYLPKPVSRLLCNFWERYSSWSRGQLPPVFNPLAWSAYWKGSRYSNQKLKTLLKWEQKVPTEDGMARFFQFCAEKRSHA